MNDEVDLAFFEAGVWNENPRAVADNLFLASGAGSDGPGVDDIFIISVITSCEMIVIWWNG